MKKIGLLVIFLLLVSACDRNGGDGDPNDTSPGTDASQPCDFGPCVPMETSYPAFDFNANFDSWIASPYVLPYKVGETHQVTQGNTTGSGHSGVWQFGYDILMCVGTDILAARAGTVVHTIDAARQTDWQGANLITIRHTDGTVAYYANLQIGGVLVKPGDIVRQGDLIGKSGNGGFAGLEPALHFSVHECADLPGLSSGTQPCNSLPINFRNTQENPNGLGSGRCYTAL